jgi:SAM-dependent methyltransferase
VNEKLDPTDAASVHAAVQSKYGAIARQGTSCCGAGTSTMSLQELGYSPEQQQQVEAGSDLGLGCGNPLAHADLQPGETVLDLGSGAGLDAFLAAREVGKTGRVIGVDMTPDMIARARAAAERGGHTNVEFRHGTIEALPVESQSVDVIMSNCVINLATDKGRVFREALRVLRPGGRLVVSDLVLRAPLPDSVRTSVEAYVGCVAGAQLETDYLRHVREAGFTGVEIAERRAYAPESNTTASCCGSGAAADSEFTDALRHVLSVKVRAVRP